MKFLICATIAVLLLASVFCVPVPLDNSLEDAFSVKSVNNTSVCVISRAVYHDGELLPFKDPCEVCRCRPPGIACAYVRCAKKDPKPDCNIVEVKGQCCPQYRCVEEAQPEVIKEVPAVVPETKPEPELKERNEILQTEAPAQDQEQESTEIQSRNEPTEASAQQADSEASEAPAAVLEERAQVENATEPPKEEPKSIELADESVTSEEPREERLDQAATEVASESPERESKKESATSAPLSDASSEPEKEERKEDGATEQSPIIEKQEQGRSDDIITAQPAQIATEAAVNDEIATGRSELVSEESNSTLEERSDDDEKLNATALSQGQDSEESTDQQPSERRRRESEASTAALQSDEQEPTEASNSSDEASEQPQDKARSEDATQAPLPATESSSE